MQYLFVLSSVLALAAAVPINSTTTEKYIVVLKSDLSPKSQSAHYAWLTAATGARKDMYGSQAETVAHRYDIPGLTGYTAKLEKSIVEQLEGRSDVEFVQKDTVMRVLATEPTKLWGLSRISSRELEDVQSYTYPDSAGSGVDVYIVDTGILTSHPDFGGRATFGKSFTGENTEDGNGHGTHCAGTVGSKTYGVAKNASLIGVQVMKSDGSGETSDIIAGIEWVVKTASAKSKAPVKAVINFSVGGELDRALDTAVQAAINAGIVFSVAAGNEAVDACNTSPAHVSSAITVAASTATDELAYFSNFGRCVDIIAPGDEIRSTWKNSRSKVESGTSMAAPHVAGVVALALGERNFDSVSAVHDYIKSIATQDKIRPAYNAEDLRETPNLLLFNGVKTSN